MATKQLLNLSDICIPNSHLPNPNGIIAEKINKSFAIEIGLFNYINEKRFYAGSSIGKYAFPNASLERLITCCQWVEWLFYIDDQFDENKILAGDKSNVTRLIDEYINLLHTGILSDNHPVNKLCISLRNKLLKLGSESLFEQLCDSTEQYLRLGVLGAVDVWNEKIPYTIEKYMHHREYDSGVYTCIDMVEIAQGIDLPKNIRSDTTIKQLRKLTTRHVAFANDLFSYDKEVSGHNNPNNLVYLFMYWENLSFEESVSKVIEIINADMVSFLELKNIVLKNYLNQGFIEKYVEGMEHWMYGNIDWSIQTSRYKSVNNNITTTT